MAPYILGFLIIAGLTLLGACIAIFVRDLGEQA